MSNPNGNNEQGPIDNDVGKYLSYASIDIDKLTLTINGNSEYTIKNLRPKKISLDYIAGLLVNGCQMYNLEYDEETLNSVAVETYTKYTDEKERCTLKLRLLMEARKLAEGIKEDNFVVELCRKYLERQHGKPPSPITMQAWTPQPDDVDEKYRHLNLKLVWDDFLKADWHEQIGFLAKASATDFLSFTEWIEKIKAKSGSGHERKTKTSEAIKLVREKSKGFFLDQHETPYAEITIEKDEGRKEYQVAYPINSGTFKNWLRFVYYRTYKGDVLGREDLQSVCDILSAQILMDSGNHRRMMHVRVAPGSNEQEGPVIYYNVMDAEYQAVKMTASGWTIEQAPTIFLRYKDQLPQVLPSKPYELDVFDRFMALTNVKTDDGKLLIKCYIISLFIPMIPCFVILMPYGPSGAAKSMLQKYIQKIVDPNANDDLLSLPTDVNELIQQIAHHYVSYYDNLSYMPERISDVFCRACTGGGMQKRKLYTDNDDVAYKFKRPTGFNGITLVASKSDLIERGLMIELERIDKKKRRKETELWAEFNSLLPELLGYIFDIVVKVLHIMKKQGGIQLDERDRMSDWAEVGEIISRAMGNADHVFLEAYARNVGLQTQEAIQANPVAQCIVKLMAKHDGPVWVGYAATLLEELEQIATNDLKMKNLQNNKSWPKAPNALTRGLNKVVTNLLEVGIAIKRFDDTSSHTTMIQIEKISPENAPKNTPETPESPKDQNRAQNGDTGIPGILLDGFSGLERDGGGNGKANGGGSSSIRCPYGCKDAFEAPSERGAVRKVVQHSVRYHKGRTIVKDLQAAGYDVSEW
jgi:hypothetical protein